MGYEEGRDEKTIHIIIINNHYPYEPAFENPTYRTWELSQLDQTQTVDTSLLKLVNPNDNDSLYLIQSTNITYMDYTPRSNNFYR